MKNVVILSSVCGISALTLAKGLNTRTWGTVRAVVEKPYDKIPAITPNDIIFRYGCVAAIGGNAKAIINKRSSVQNCISKIKTFAILKKAGVPIVDYCTDWSKVPKNWDIITVRKSQAGRKAADLDYIEHHELIKFRDAELFTEYFQHKYEYRIVIFMGRIVGRYYKSDDKGEWTFKLQPPRGFEEMDAACLKAAKALDIDYVGFDVVANTKRDFKILEANSGPVITPESEEAIVNYFYSLQD